VDIITNGRIATMRMARKEYTCRECGLPIKPGEKHYCVTYAGAGLGSTKFPDRVHEYCVDRYLAKPVHIRQQVDRGEPGWIRQQE